MIKQLAEDELYESLKDSYEVAAIFNEEELACMWIDNTPIEEVKSQYLRDDDWWSVLECKSTKEGYIDSNGNEIYYCYNER